ncbi:MAG: type II toxin-antitoxin system RelE/ParE family toxin [Actinobacteria bacterium]|nr:type II toxin-antitoxin system RelE/ParE family toxin [Actinomycetota bacterium]
MTQEARYRLVITPTARRQLGETLSEAVAFAAYEFIVGPLLEAPHRVGERLQSPLNDRHSARRGTYRVIYRNSEDRTVIVVSIVRRADAYRSV